MKLQTIISNVISAIIQPIFIPIYGYTMLLSGDPFLSTLTSESKIFVWMVVFCTTSLLPAVLVLSMVYMGKISNTFISNKEERHLPYIVSFIGYMFCCYLLLRGGMDMIYVAPIIGTGIGVIIIFSINTKWKISAHLSTMGGMTGGLIAYSIIFGVNILPLIIISVLASGILGWARIILKAHTLAQVYCGWLFGFSFVVIAWFIAAN